MPDRLSAVRKWRSVTGVAILLVFQVLLFCILIPGCNSSSGDGVQTTPDAVNVVLVPASEWNGVDIYDNHRPHSEPTNYQYGQKWQCVEVVQRLYAQKWGFPPVWPVSYAYQMFDNAPEGIERHPNGDTCSTPVWGDAVVFGRRFEGDVGHVAIVTGVSDGKVYLVEQNGGDGTAEITIDEKNHLGKLGSMEPVGWLHPRGTYSGPAVIIAGGISPERTVLVSLLTVLCLVITVYLRVRTARLRRPPRMRQPRTMREGELYTTKTPKLVYVIMGSFFILLLVGSSITVFYSMVTDHNSLVPLVSLGKRQVTFATSFILHGILELSIAVVCGCGLVFCSRSLGLGPRATRRRSSCMHHESSTRQPG